MLASTLALPLLQSVAAALRSSGNGHLAGPEMSKRVAIIGAGAGGSSAAYYLSKYAQEEGTTINIDVFEKSSRAGGRTTTVNAWSDPNNPVELGGSIFVEVNQILVNAMKEFNLSTNTRSIQTPEADALPELGVWNGNEFVVITTSDTSWWDKAKLLWRYGTAPIKTNSLMKSTVGKFLNMYEPPVFPWASLNEAVDRVGLLEVTGVTGQQFLKANGVGDLFANEIIQASTRVNYASNLPLIHGLETMVCMATEGAMAVEGGNWQIFAHMLKSSSMITPHFNTTVTKLQKQNSGYNLTTSDGNTSAFDAVILAAPYQFAKLNIDPTPNHVPDAIPYVKLQVTLFATPHKLSSKAFNLEEGKNVPQFVLTTLLPNEDHGNDPNGVGTPGFFSISIVSSGVNPRSASPRPEYIYKIFSPERINATFLSHILGQPVTEQEAADGSPDGAVSWIHHKTWHSYPREYPRVTFEEIKLDDGLYYTSGIESFISTMETSALSGKNVARLVVDSWEPAKSDETLRVQGADWQYQPLEEPVELKAKL